MQTKVFEKCHKKSSSGTVLSNLSSPYANQMSSVSAVPPSMTSVASVSVSEDTLNSSSEERDDLLNKDVETAEYLCLESETTEIVEQPDEDTDEESPCSRAQRSISLGAIKSKALSKIFNVIKRPPYHLLIFLLHRPHKKGNARGKHLLVSAFR